MNVSADEFGTFRCVSLHEDLDPKEFGGNVTWLEPADASRVQELLLGDLRGF